MNNFQSPNSLQMQMISGEMRLSKFEEISSYYSHMKFAHILVLRSIEAYRLGRVRDPIPVFEEPFSDFDGLRRAGQALRARMDAHYAERTAAN